MKIVNGIIQDEGISLKGLCGYFGVGKRADGAYYPTDLMRSGSIKPKSKIKPVEYPYDDIIDIAGEKYGQATRLLDQQRRKINYGHNFKYYENALDAIRGVIKGENFMYEPPVGWNRLSDFIGYNDNPTDWHNTVLSHVRPTLGAKIKVSVEPIDEVLTYGAMSGLLLKDMNLGFLMWKDGFVAEQPQIYFYSCSDSSIPEHSLDVLLSDESLQIDTSKVGEGLWVLYPVLTTAKYTKDSMTYIREEDSNGKWYPYPYCASKYIDIVKTGGDDQILDLYITCESVEADVEVLDGANLVYNIKKIAVTFANRLETVYDIDFEIEIKGAISEVNKPVMSGHETLPIGTTEFVVFDYTKVEDDYRVQIGTLPIEASIRYWIKTDTGVQDNTATFTIYE